MDIQSVRKKNRLQNYDYSQNGAYFITICTENRKCLLSTIVGATLGRPAYVQLTQWGLDVEQAILRIPQCYPDVHLEKYVIMPNHIHAIITISERINPFPTKKYDISNVVGKFKAAVTRNAGNAFMHSEQNKIWQKSFHDHIIRDEEDYLKIWNYIDVNPQKWSEDCFYIKN